MNLMRLRRTRPPRTRAADGGVVTDEPADTAPAEHPERELASRQNDGLHIVLLWNPRDDAVAVSVADRRNGHEIRFPVAASRALHAFHHPFAYAP